MPEASAVKNSILKIAEMTTEQVQDFRPKISTSTLSRRGKEFLYRACDERINELNQRKTLEAVHGDMSDFN